MNPEIQAQIDQLVIEATAKIKAEAEAVFQANLQPQLDAAKLEGKKEGWSEVISLVKSGFGLP